jgi:tetratricopeptide (TPR) repeat protein
MKWHISFSLYFSLIIGFAHSAFSQCKDISTSASREVIEKKALFEDARGSKFYKEARAPLNWLLKNAPNLSTGLYIMGAETYDALAKAEQNPEKKKVYVDSLMIIYDLRMKNCGEEANVTNRKAFSFFYYYYDDVSKSKEILPLIDKAMELNGENILDGLAEFYMRTVKISNDHTLIKDGQILERYNKITSIIDSKIKKVQGDEDLIDRYRKMHDDNFAILATLIKIDCDFVRKNLGPEFKENPANINLAKNIFNFMLKDKCTEDALWLQAAEVLHASEKDFGLAKILGMRYLSAKDHDRAAKMLEEALTLATKSSDKADILGLQAQQQEMLNNLAKARELYLRALSLDPGKKEFYGRIGDMYLHSFEACAKAKHQADDRLVFLIAYDMYLKAGETQKMANAKSLFPSREEIFELDYKAGDKIKVACWINEETIIRTRN